MATRKVQQPTTRKMKGPSVHFIKGKAIPPWTPIDIPAKDVEALLAQGWQFVAGRPRKADEGDEE